MKHFASPRFWRHYRRLPQSIRALSDKSFELLKADPQHPALRLKQIGDLWSVRVGGSYRALGVSCEGGITWFWIGPTPTTTSFCNGDKDGIVLSEFLFKSVHAPLVTLWGAVYTAADAHQKIHSELPG